MVLKLTPCPKYVRHSYKGQKCKEVPLLFGRTLDQVSGVSGNADYSNCDELTCFEFSLAIKCFMRVFKRFLKSKNLSCLVCALSSYLIKGLTFLTILSRHVLQQRIRRVLKVSS